MKMGKVKIEFSDSVENSKKESNDRKIVCVASAIGRLQSEWVESGSPPQWNHGNCSSVD